MSWPQRIVDYLWHIALPVTALVVGGFAGLAMLTKNSFLDEINKQYVATARAKGLSRRRVLYGHVFRNAMLIVVAGFPSAFVAIFFAGELLIEVIFSLNGLGLLGFEAAVNRDYPVMFGTLYLYTLIGLLLNIVTDLTYTVIDPRIDFERRDREPLAADAPPPRRLPRPAAAATGRCGSSSRCSCSRSAPTCSPTTARSSCATTAASTCPSLRAYPGDRVRRRAADRGRPIAIPTCGGSSRRADGSCGRPSRIASTRSTGTLPGPAPAAAVRAPLAGHRRPGPRPAGPARLRLPRSPCCSAWR